MNKFLFSCALGLFSSAALALPFDGFYVGGVVGGTKAIVTNNQKTNASLIVSGVSNLNIMQNNNPKLSDASWIGGVDLGVGKVFAQYYYLGIEGVAQFEDVKSSNTFNLTGTTTTPLDYIHKVTTRLNNELALTVNPGIVFKETTLFYGKIGPTWGRVADNGTFDFSESIDPVDTAQGL